MGVWDPAVAQKVPVEIIKSDLDFAQLEEQAANRKKLE